MDISHLHDELLHNRVLNCLSTFSGKDHTAAHAVYAETIVGVVAAVDESTKSIVVDEGSTPFTTVYCIPFNYLENNKNRIFLDVGVEVIIEAYDRTFSDGTTKLVATIVNGVEVPSNR